MRSTGNLADANKAAQIAEKRRQALSMREMGYSYEEIAQALGWTSRATAYAFVKRALKATYQEPADEVRKLELKRLDRLTRAIWQKATGKVNSDGTVEPPDLFALDRLLKLMNRRAALLGLDAPVKVKTDITSKGEALNPLFNIVDNSRNGTPHTNGEPVPTNR